MVPDQLKARTRRVVEEIINQGDLAVATQLISPDCVLHVLGGQSVAGLTALRDWLALTLCIFPDFHAVVEDEIAEDARVVQRLTCYGTHQGDFPGSRATGEPVTFGVIEISRAGADGKFTEHWSSIDVPTVLCLLSAPPQMWPTASPGEPDGC